MSDTACPLCGADLRGDRIPDEHRHWYGDRGYYSRVIGHEVRGVYDGVLFWSCPDCGQAWPRFTEDDRLGRQAREHVDRWNLEHAARRRG